MQEVVKWKSGSRIKNRPDAEKARKEITRISEKYGSAKAEFIVEESKKKKALLHDSFEWDDSVAGFKHRCQQAREITNSITVEYITEGKEEESVTVPAFVVPEKGQGYRAVEVVMSNPEMRNQIISKAKLELESWVRRYEHLSEFATIVSMIKKAV